MSLETRTSSRMTFVRTFLIVAFAVLLGAQQFSDMLLPWKPFGTYGFSATTFGDVTSVQPGSPAALAGIEPGDRIEISHLSYHERRRILYLTLSPPGETMTFPVVHRGVKRAVTLTSVVYARTLAENVSDIVETFERLVLIGIAVFLVLKRPSLLTFSFYLIALGSEGGASLAARLSDTWLHVNSFVTNGAIIAGACASIVFAMMFPRPAPTRAIVRTAYGLLALAVVWLGINVATSSSMMFSWSMATDPTVLAWVFRLDTLLPGVLAVSATLAFIVNYVRSSDEDRVRMQWVAFGFAIGSIGNFGTPIIIALFSYQPPLWLQNSVLTLNIFIPVTVAYAILRHHIVDLRFFLSRALVYSAVTGIAVVTLILLELVVSKQLEEYHLALAVEVAGALVIGIGMNRFHKAIDELIERFIFRSVFAAEKHLGNVGDAMMFARSAEQIDALLAEESARSLDLSSVRITRVFDDSDRLALRLHAARALLEEAYDVAIPILIRDRLFGYARFGPHRNGSAIDPKEREILAKLCERAAIAYDHVTSEERAAENESLRAQIDVLTARNDELRSIVRG
ncbi:MAG: hypothetical protein KGN02_03855 [bacterium]|nr:hypothetical protein [bacterium]